jgi:hypothetical protein
LWAIAGLVVVAAASGPAWAQSTSRTPRFAEIVSDHFAAWDADHDGRISPSEIDRACVSADVHGPEAAAIAALKRIIRSEKYDLPALTKDYLAKPMGRAGRRTPVRDADREDSTEKTHAHEVDDTAPATPTLSASDFQSRYAQCLTRIEKTDRSLFKDQSDVAMEHCHQGPLGDCFFISVIGGMVHHDSGAVRSMITPIGDNGGYDVRFGNSRTVHVAPLTDAEIALSSTTIDRGGQIGGEGLWLAVLEKAYGTLKMSDAPSRYTTESATDALAKGGSTSGSIQLLTGHRAERIVLKRPVRGSEPDQTDVDGRRISSGPSRFESAGNVDALERRVQSAIDHALAAGRLVATGTGDEKVPPGMSPKHAYAVLALNTDTDMVTVWNPHGNSFRPRGDAGLSNGYVTKSGVFEIPMRDFVRVFNGVTLETDRPMSSHSTRG